MEATLNKYIYIRKEKLPTVPLEEAEELRDRLDTPMEQFMAKEERVLLLRRLPRKRMQMVFILREYGFNDDEIAKGMSLRKETVQTIRAKIKKIRKILFSQYN